MRAWAAVLDGIVLGLQFGLLGVGLTLVYGLGGVLNLAHGQMAVLAAIATSVGVGAGLPLAVAILGGLLLAGVIGVALDLTLMRPVYRLEGESRVLLGLLLMVGFGFVLDGFLGWRYPAEALGIRMAGDPIPVLGVDMRRGSLVAAAVAVAVGGGLVAFFRATVTGRAVRSVIQDEVGARLCGINPSRVRTFIFGLSGVLAAVVAITRSLTSPVPATAGIELTTQALIVAVVGGLGSVTGAFAAGILLGVVTALSSAYIGSYITTIVLLAAAALTIVLRPSGILGGRA